MPLIRSTEVDENGDGIPDRLEINIKTPIVPGETIYGSSTFLFFDYQVRAGAAHQQPLSSIPYLANDFVTDTLSHRDINCNTFGPFYS